MRNFKIHTPKSSPPDFTAIDITPQNDEVKVLRASGSVEKLKKKVSSVLGTGDDYESV